MKTKQQRRLTILRDAIKQIKSNTIIANPGSVVQLPYINRDYINREQPIIEAKPQLIELFKQKKKCYACARGALLLCTVHKENDFLLEDFEQGGCFDEKSNTDKRLLRLFSSQQLMLMENAFEVETYLKDLKDDCIEENYNYSINKQLPKKLQDKSLKFGAKYENKNERLLAIFQNAIKNKGLFKP